MRVLAQTFVIVTALAAPAAARDSIRPAELPPASFAGQQYVDSKGCLFVRAGTATEVLWIPRVTQQGAQMCSSPPSGERVPVAEEIGVQPVPTAKPSETNVAKPKAATSGEAVEGTGGYLVAVGSFGVTSNADRAEARLLERNYRVIRGRVQGASATLTTVFAGPFADAATAAQVRDALKADGFPDATVIRP